MRPCFGERLSEIAYLIAANVMSERIGQVPIRGHDLHLAELRFNAYPAIKLSRLTELRAIGVPVIGDHFAAGKTNERICEIIDAIWRYVDAIFGYKAQGLVGGRDKMRVQLHLHAARPFHDGVYPNRILERFDEDAGARGARRKDRLIHVGDEVSGPLEAKRIGNGGCVRERRDSSYRRHNGLKLSAACGRCA